MEKHRLKRPAIARIWRGRTRGERAAKFVTISSWESVEAMAAFTGRDPRQAITWSALRSS